MNLARKLLVEGRDDQHVIHALLEHHKVPETFKVEEKGGIDNLLAAFPVQAKGSNIQTLGVVIDADINATGRWRSIRASLLTLGYTDCPNDIPATGLVLEADELPRIGAWIMPDNSMPGMLEDFVSYLVPAGDQLWVYASDIIAEMPENVRPFSSVHLSKVRIHTWLAWQADPGTPLGLAITKNYLDADAQTTAPFLDWLRRLFVTD